jgi:putative hydrolases of HD superfamily
MTKSRLEKQIEFAVEADKLKEVERETLLMNGVRSETSAEHSWHIALAALILSEHAMDKNLDLFRVLKMLLIHDLVEIDAGDTYCYDPVDNTVVKQEEKRAARRLFSLLPQDQEREFFALWEEFEAGGSPDARFANALDRFLPVISSFMTKGCEWKKKGIRRAQVEERVKPVGEASPALFNCLSRLLEEAVEKGFLRP